MHILIATDKFKGSLSATEAAEAIQRGMAHALPKASFDLTPIADGGEGTAEIFQRALGGKWVSEMVSDPLGRPVKARYLWLANDSTAAIDMSEASGFWRLSAQEKNPLLTTTRGTGELISDAIRRGARRIFIGLGGSATNDAGCGMAAALGYRFLDEKGESIDPLPSHLARVTRIAFPDSEIPEVIGLCDVNSPLLGPQGASHVFGPQKGASSAQVEELERALQRLSHLVTRDLGIDPVNIPGAGAAGGLGYGLLAFCHGKLQSGFTTMVDLLNLEERVKRSDLVITGEGSLDEQTLEGKALAGIAHLARTHEKPVIAFGGKISDTKALLGLFDSVIPITEHSVPLAESMSHAASFLEKAASRAALQLPRFTSHP